MGGMYDEIPDYRYRLIDYVGDGFVLGSSFGSAFHFIRGFCNSPNGGRLAGGVHAVRTNVPPVAGRFAAELAVSWAFESGMSLMRGREDHWNSIVAGTVTLGLVNVHRGAPVAARSAFLSATFFVGLAGAYLNFESWHSRLLRSGREVRKKDGLPALVPIRRITPCRAALLRSGREVRKKDGLPALVPIRHITPCRASVGDAAGGSIEYRSENDAIPDLSAMERKSEMTPKDV